MQHYVNIYAEIPSFLFIIIAIYLNIKLYGYKDASFMQKRRLWITFALNITLCTAMLSKMLASVLISNTLTFIPFEIAPALFVFSTCFVLYILNVRNWMIYYQYHYTYYITESEWRTILDPTLKEQTNWFIKNAHKYGKLSYIAKLFGLLHLIGTIIGASCMAMRAKFTADATEADDHDSVHSTLSITMLLIAIAIWVVFIMCYACIVCKTPKFNDCWHIHWESTMHSRLICAIPPIAVISNVVGYFTNIYILMALFSVNTSTVMFCMIYVSTNGVISKNAHNVNPTQSRFDLNNMKLEKAESASPRSPRTFHEILQDKLAFHEFFNHLFSEYSTELLLCFIEINQYERYVIDCGFFDESELSSIDIVELHSEVPLSFIVKSNFAVNGVIGTECPDEQQYNVRMKAHKLWQKYIAENSELCINISSKMRKKLTNLLQDETKLMQYNITMLDMLYMFDEVKQEIVKLMRYSLTRFQSKPATVEVLTK